MPTPAASPHEPGLIVDSATLFGRCLATVRRDLGLTQAEFAKTVGLTRPGLTRIETGRSTPSYYVLMRLGQRVRPRSGADASSIIALVYLAATALKRQGIRTVNRPATDGDQLLDQARLDRVIAAVYDREFREHAPVDMFEFGADADAAGQR